MRILAIRGQNLASLAEPFALEFDEVPLRDAGLFAITGPTGSGKSTLLDAMCAALFDATPRLNAKSSVLVGRAGEDEAMRVGMSDVRALLRRGAGEGMAQVDFLGTDGKRYRSTWRVRRARGRADGRLQPQTVELTELTSGKVIGGTKTQTLAAISDRLGLTFEQFRRSSLLAQGDFAAFVTAPSRERAALLERVTGTELYSEVSRAAHRRSAWEKEQIKLLEATLEVMGRDVMSAEALRGMSERAAELASREASLSEAEQRWSAYEAHLAATGPLATMAEQADEAVASAGDDLQGALSGWTVARLEATWPKVHAHKARWEAAQETLAKAQAEEAQVRAAFVAASETLEAEAASIRAMEASIAELSASMAAFPWASPLLPRWSEVREELHRAAGLLNRLDELERVRPSLLDAVEVAEAGVKKAQAQAAERLARSAADEDALAQHAGEIGAGWLAGRWGLEAIDAVIEALAQAAELARTRAELTQAHDEATGAAKAAREEVERAAASIAEIEALVVAAQARLEEAEHAAGRLKSRASFEEHRSVLMPGEPCPLCGAEEHPYAAEDTGLGAALAEATQRFQTLREELGALERRRGAARESERSWKGRVQAHVGSAEATSGELEAIIRTHDAMWVALASRRVPSGGIEMALADLEPPYRVDPGAPESSVATAQAWHAARARIAGCQSSRQQAAEAEQDVLNAKLAVAPHRDALVDNARQREALSARIEDTVEDRREVLDGLPGWPERFRQDPSRWLEETERRVQVALAKEAALEEATERRDAHGVALEKAQARGELTEREHSEALRRCQSLQEASAQAKSTLVALIEPMDVEGFEQFSATVRRQKERLERLVAVAQERSERLLEHRNRRPQEPPFPTILGEPGSSTGAGAGPDEPVSVRVRRVLADVREERQGIQARLSSHEEDQHEARRAAEALAERKAAAAPWLKLGDLIGHHDGQTFRKFAQSLTLDLLVAHANRHLEDLARRFQLMRVPGYDLELQVVDRDLGDDVRTIRSLSGGETFLVSLALALSLSSVSSSTTHVKTLFIDEGFGTLDPGSLEMALAALDALQASGCQVGVISHVPGLAERIGVQVAVAPRGAGRSSLRVVAARG